MSSVDLSKFAAAGDTRTWMRAPFGFLGGVCATNGHIAIWVPGEADEAEGVPPGLAKMFEPARDAVPGIWWVTAKELAVGEPQPCGVCAGHGRVVVEGCDDCDGSGYFDHGRHEYECLECNGDGHVHSRPSPDDIGDPCHACSGTGRKGIPIAVSAGFKNGINSIYLHLIQELPGALLHMENDTAPIIFKFDGGYGLVMPMTGVGR